MTYTFSDGKSLTVDSSLVTFRMKDVALFFPVCNSSPSYIVVSYTADDNKISLQVDGKRIEATPQTNLATGPFGGSFSIVLAHPCPTHRLS